MDRRAFIEYVSLLCGINLVPKDVLEYSDDSHKNCESSCGSGCCHSYTVSSISSSSSLSLDYHEPNKVVS